MHKIFYAPIADTIISSILDTIVQNILFVKYFQHLSTKISTIMITFVSLLINFLVIIFTYSFIYKKSIFEESKLYLQGLFTIGGILILFPIYIYFMLIILKDEPPNKKISLIILFSYIIGYICKVITTYFIWGYN